MLVRSLMLLLSQEVRVASLSRMSRVRLRLGSTRRRYQQHLSPLSAFWLAFLVDASRKNNPSTHQPATRASYTDSLTHSTRHNTRVSEHVYLSGPRDHRLRAARSSTSFGSQPATQTEERLGRRHQDCTQAKAQQDLPGRVFAARRRRRRWSACRDTHHERSRANRSC